MSRGKNSIDQETMLLFLETLIQASLNVIVSFTKHILPIDTTEYIRYTVLYSRHTRESRQ